MNEKMLNTANLECLSEDAINEALNEISQKKRVAYELICEKYDAEYDRLKAIYNEKYGPKYDEYVGRYFLERNEQRFVFYAITGYENMKLQYKALSFFIRYTPENEDLPRHDTIRKHSGEINAVEFDNYVTLVKKYVEISRADYENVSLGYEWLLDTVEDVAGNYIRNN